MKKLRATDQLNLAISTVSAAATALNSILEQTPDSDLKRKFLIIEEQIDKGVTEAFAVMSVIRKAAESI